MCIRDSYEGVGIGAMREALKQLGFPGLKGTGEMAEQPD